jgi:glutamate N-acetyltransferase/amino-acid N-acetyltransferase
MKLLDRIVLPRGFTAAGVAAGIKSGGRKDMALIFSDRPAAAGGLFTTNQVKAAPVKVDQPIVKRGVARGIVVNSGNANACVGAQGMKDARRMAELAAEALSLSPRDMLVCSTGVIGKPMPMAAIEKGIRSAASRLGRQGGNDAAAAIMTTDTRPKRATAVIDLACRKITITAMAKGAGMIAPNMATLLAFVLTDAAVERRALQSALREATRRSFNRITVDGDMSTNDTVLLLANGAAGNAPLGPGRPGWSDFTAALDAVTLDLARKIARDGEGATKLITVSVRGARTDAEADSAARSVANSMLVKTCWNGDYPNWGRIMDALGYSRARVVEEKVEIRYGDVVAVRNGISAGAPMDRLSRIQRADPFAVTIDLHLGRGAAEVYTCDLSEEYVRINVDYVKLTTGKAPT